MQLLEHFKELTIHPKNTAELKGLILQLSIQGKLTQKWREQNPNVEHALVLLEKIKAEKEQLIKERKIKKEKPLPEITEDEVPFLLPESWGWTRLGDIIKISSGKNLTSAKMNKNGKIPVYGGNGITGYHSEANIFEPTIVIGRVGFYCGSVYLTEDEAWITDNAFITQFSTNNIYRNYLVWLLKGTNLKEEENATAQPVISGRKVYPIIVALPPLSEQRAIVSIVNQLFKEVDELEAQTRRRVQLKEDFVQSALRRLTEASTIKDEWVFLQQHFKSFFNTKESVKKLRETILQLAVQGKLTTHWRKSHPELVSGSYSAASLLEKIKAEKAQLIKAGTIKKEKPLPAIANDEIPYELPDGWVWCRMQEIGLFERGKSKHRPRNDNQLFNDGRYPLVQTGDVSSAKTSGGIISTHKSMYNDFGLAQSRMWTKGTLCITIAANIAETGILGYDACFPDSVVGFTSLVEDFNPRFIEYFITITKSDLEKYAPSTAQKNINLGILYQLKYPLPPLEEQKAIIAKVNSLMALCDSLEHEIEQNTKQVEDLMQSCLKELLEGKKEDGQDDLEIRMTAESETKYISN